MQVGPCIPVGTRLKKGLELAQFLGRHGVFLTCAAIVFMEGSVSVATVMAIAVEAR